MPAQEVFTLPPVGLWTGALDMVPSARARDLAAELESLGYGALWLPEVAGRDPFVHLTMLLSATERMIGATGIASIWARDAVTTSCAAKALTEAFPHRVLVGLGVSHENLVGGPARAPVRPTVDGHAALPRRPRPRALHRAPPDHAGPLRPRRPPATDARPRRRTNAGCAHLSRHSRAHVQGAERPRPNATVVPRAGRGAGDRRRKARAIARAHVSVYRVVARVHAHLDAGADHVPLQVLPKRKRGVPDTQWRELTAPLAELADAIVPHRGSTTTTKD